MIFLLRTTPPCETNGPGYSKGAGPKGSIITVRMQRMFTCHVSCAQLLTSFRRLRGGGSPGRAGAAAAGVGRAGAALSAAVEDVLAGLRLRLRPGTEGAA